MVDRVFGKASIGGETICAMALFRPPIVEARSIHTLTAALALAATGMDFDCDALPNPELVDIGAERRNRSHVLMSRGEVLVERQAALDVRG